MKVKIAAGGWVRLDGRRTTSIKGGTYDLDRLKVSEQDQKRVAGLKGVTEVKGSKKEGGDK